jgi:hypothetical protein
MNVITAIYVAALFYVLSPGVIMKSPFKFSKMVVLLIHALIFSVIFMFTIDYVQDFGFNMTEGMVPDKEKEEEEQE